MAGTTTGKRGRLRGGDKGSWSGSAEKDEVLFILDAKLVIKSISPSAARTLGFRPEDLIGRDCREIPLLAPDSLRTAVLQANHILRSGEPSTEKYTFLAQGGIERPVLITGHPLVTSGGAVEGVVWISKNGYHGEVEETLKKKEEELAVKSAFLEETNTALKVLLRNRDEGRASFENAILDNLKKLVFPCVRKLRATRLDENQAALLSVMESNLNDVFSPFLGQVAAVCSEFTPAELQVARLIREGRSSKEIAGLLGVSKRTVDTHRDSMRSKLGLRGRKINLRSRLMSLEYT